ncbi:N5-glutamine methyltransferase family protein [Xiamenia xianingshaonis]|uniref:Release factor glutamine methyltransferase n=1 Tax=Xiamenia xianingshaonis TaxID=2682776 RepID=A0A9E6STW6_9ACTN|nr:HemK/PrmC family methyltransferase [Xiamenia xianingshaonis]NHM14493.1 HemK family protein methyltransferase [Xiamenia xianingshaonis]QTU83784.1 peptide chain release factor N(5)-glutamine methyltransferase [Xiamenia xianingshaonis]
MSADVWTVKAALDWTVGYLGRKGDENPRLSAEWLLSEACELSRIQLYVSFDRPLTGDERDRLRDFVQRRGAGEPLQYITGEVGFRHITVKVRPGVLIPRPETEVLVSEALALLPAPERPRWVDPEPQEAPEEARPAEEALPSRDLGDDAPARADEAPAASDAGAPTAAADAATAADATADAADAAATAADAADAAVPSDEALRVADLCTGSGCIACSLAFEHPKASVVATDLSPAAVALAQENVAALGLEGRVGVLCCDLGEKIPDRLMGTFDLVVSNPPYVPTAVVAGLAPEVRDFEPALALDGGADGNDFVRRILPWAARALRPGAGFALELHETCLDAAANIARDLGFSDVRITCDLAGRPRVLTGRRPGAPAVADVR